MASAKIMVASGTGGIRIEIRKNLEKHYYNVVADAANQPDLIKNYKINKPDILVLDLNLEDGDATPCIKQILDYDGKARIIAISAIPDKQTIYNAITTGAKKFLPKPIDMNKLIDAIRTLLA